MKRNEREKEGTRQFARREFFKGVGAALVASALPRALWTCEGDEHSNTGGATMSGPTTLHVGSQGAGVVDTRRSPHFRLQSVPIGAVKLREGFWKRRLDTNRITSIPGWLKEMEERGVVDNFRRVSGRKDVAFREGSHGSESDLYKWLEAAAFTIQNEDGGELRQTLERIIDDVRAAQGADGYLYLNTFMGLNLPAERFKRLERSHELYCAGHLIQAGIAHYRATGEETLLDAGIRFADYLTEKFGAGKIEESDGHPEIELALIELYRTTGKQAYLDLAGFFLSRPQSSGNLPPIAERPALAGHAVRSGYICIGGADWYGETGDEKTWSNLKHLWEDLVTGKIYITGGVGARYRGEAFGEPYELPNARAYCETCAQIAHVMWAYRMLLLSGEAQYADVMEQILYNAFLSGVSLSGSEYFYMNPLASDGGYRRQAWFPTNCCPPNVQRMLASLPGYMFTTSAEGLWVHLYDACEATLDAPDGVAVTLGIDTQYPWHEIVEITVSPAEPTEFGLFLRVPNWAEGAALAVNGEAPAESLKPGSYARLRRRWKSGDSVRLELHMPVRLMESHPRVQENRGCLALKRGPIVYCLESVDNPRVAMPDLALNVSRRGTEVALQAEWRPHLLGGVTVVHCNGSSPGAGLDLGPSCRLWGTSPAVHREGVAVTAIPYYAWANRGDSAMRVWVPVEGG